MKHLLAAAALLAFNAPALAEDAAAVADAEVQELGPAIGAIAPSVVAKDAAGADRAFADLTGDNGLVLVFVRSAEWCPFCIKQLEDLTTVQADLEAQGYNLAALSYDAPEKLAAFADKSSIDYTLLSDAGSTVISAFGVLNEDIDPTSKAYGIPHPIIMMIGADGVVQAKLYEDGYRDRPPSGVVADTVAGLVAS